MKTNYLIKHFLGTFLFFAVIFISAGRLYYIPGLTYVAIGLVMFILNYTVLRIDPELQEERSKPGKDSLQWDKTILGLSFLLTISMFVVAGLDSGRYHWSPDFPSSLFITGIILTAGGQLIFLIAQKQNKFFSSMVRIQTNRDHAVYEKGLYSFVRHPAYLGSIIQAAGFPLLFGSIWSIIPVGLLIILFIVRTYLEDKTLRNSLKGYSKYAVKTRYRLIPLIW